MTNIYHPLRSLREGHWFKLICGASFQHLPAVRNLTLAFTLAGADCIDVAADPAIITVAQAAMQMASQIATSADGYSGRPAGLPWLMVSLNDGEDPHFRKAEFDPGLCPADCSRPCEMICPAQAIVFDRPNGHSGVLSDRCYGCGRCLPICPVQQITTRSFMVDPASLAPLVLQGVDALEIHTQVGRWTEFRQLWQAITPWTAHLKLIAISCPDGEGLIDYLWSLYDLITPLPCTLLWQTDGRPMSGDIGDGATRATVKLGQKVLAAGLPGYVQLAGGTNSHTVEKLRTLGLLHQRPGVLAQQPGEDSPSIAGIAYGSYARVLLSPILEKLEALSISHLEAVPELLQEAIDRAASLVSQLKSSVRYYDPVPFR
ncbi:4Fe-4S ferredoxin [Leptolyngbya sp. 'hensonii']|uniref:circadian clock protein LdpA n=1 Tax=Leptolyngbya sp. 'hensonii' TaxID=1922337 RepID=UPI00095005E3|nr:LdpA C-terminal domain-containing domain [Leptolyngbya sp. 'hensonii']OLP15423.1 4Fe-4S ferredoxin [Leptolyngbya sp. 'hensonii']